MLFVMAEVVGMLRGLGCGQHHGRSVDCDPAHGRSESTARARRGQPVEPTRLHSTRRLPHLRASLCHDP